jgi:RNA polymerase-binding transcription factor DksA
VSDATPDHDAPIVDLDHIGRELAGVEAALQRLDDGSYWTDEVTGLPLSEELLAVDPVARRATQPGGM